jgi:hypothetical protein
MNADIINAIRQASGTHNTDFSTMVVCEIDGVDLSTRSCTCIPLGEKTSSALTGVQLMAAVDDGLLIEPVVGSTVIVCYSKRNVPYVAMFSEISKVTLITVNGIQLQLGEFGGLVKVIELTEKINNLEIAYNSLVEKFNTHTHILALTTGTGTAAITAEPEVTILTLTAREEIENDSITHGK